MPHLVSRLFFGPKILLTFTFPLHKKSYNHTGNSNTCKVFNGGFNGRLSFSNDGGMTKLQKKTSWDVLRLEKKSRTKWDIHDRRHFLDHCITL